MKRTPAHRPAALACLAACLLAPAAAPSRAEEVGAEPLPLEGLWTHLLYKNRPAEPRRLPVLYAKQWGDREKLTETAGRLAGEGLPVVIDIEREPKAGGAAWLLDRTRDEAEVFAEAEAYMLSRLELARGQGVRAGLWSRPSQNGLGLIASANRPDLKAVYEQRIADAAKVLEQQDFLAIQLYFPAPYRTHADRDWPPQATIARGEWFLDRHRRLGKPSVLFVSPTWGGGKSESVPPEWLEGVVEHFLRRGDAVCIWGGQGKTWCEESPMCQAIAGLMARSGPAPEPGAQLEDAATSGDN